jgi:hypothetical protein
VEEGILDIELVHGPTPGDSQSQHSMDSGRLNDGAEGLVIVHLGALSEPPEDPTSLVPIWRAIRLSLYLKIHLSVTTLALEGRGTMSHVLLDNRASYSSIAQHQWGSASALRMEVRTGDSVGGAAESYRRSMGLVTPTA